MDGSVDAFQLSAHGFSGEASVLLAETEEARTVLAVLAAFLTGGVAVTLHGLAAAASWH